MRPNRTGLRGLYLKHGKYVWQPPMRDGRRPAPVHLSTSDFAEAVAEVARIREAEFIRQATEPMADLIAAFLRDKAAQGEHRGKVTTQTARPGLDRLARFMACPVGHVTTEKVRAWKAAMLAEDLSRATIAGYMRYAQSFFSWLVRERKVSRNPFQGQRGLFPKSIPTKRETALTKEQRDRLLAACDYLPLKAVLFFGFHAGLRRGEILNLRHDWIVRDEAGKPRFIHVQNVRNRDGGGLEFTIKDAEAKRVPISDPLAAFLVEEYRVDDYAGDPFLIRPDLKRGKGKYRWEFRRRWETFMKAQGLPEVEVHTMRHTWFSLLLSAPSDKRPSPLQLERWSGTAWTTIRKSYAHLLDDGSAINAAN